MKKDGTVYLCLVRFTDSNHPMLLPRPADKWELLHWGIPAMGATHNKPGWCNQSGLGVKVAAILSYTTLDRALFGAGLMIDTTADYSAGAAGGCPHPSQH